MQRCRVQLDLLAPRDQLDRLGQTDLLALLDPKVKRAKRVRLVQRVRQGQQVVLAQLVPLVKRGRRARLGILVEQVQLAPQDRLVKKDRRVK